VKDGSKQKEEGESLYAATTTMHAAETRRGEAFVLLRCLYDEFAKQ
jgi:hypothetical protein